MFSFPNPVDEHAARTVAAGVLLLSVMALAFRQPLILIPLAYGFWARVLTGPRLSPLGLIATRLVAPRLRRPKPVAGPPKRFAQAMGATLSSTALVLWYGFGLSTATWAVVATVAVAAFLESVFAICLGCTVFGFLMRAGVVPEEVCAACADISMRYPQLARRQTA
ncbi:MAG TPA: DUF4395 domain-containing protein [Acidimicrobiales bacterium]|nr:DUF4395 domain-containing protein [Acidimicrobiales bacterium]